MRLIDGDALKSALAHAAKDYCNRNGPLRTIDFESLIDNAPTIDAIPVAWMEDKLNATAVTNPDLNNAIFYTLVAWEQQKQNHEQEAR